MTTQLTSYDLEMVYREATQDGSEVVAIHLSSSFSGTYQSAEIAVKITMLTFKVRHLVMFRH